jgi:K+-transporting ATPase KdpF subunit
LNAPLVTGGPGSLVSVENLIGLMGGIALVVYLFIALTRPEWF